ncbi:MAG: glycosidase [Novosphingobium sp.]
MNSPFVADRQASPHAVDRLVFGPRDVELSRSPLAGRFDAETCILGAFNPGLLRLPGGNLMMMVRIAEALVEPIVDGHARTIRWEDGTFRLDQWPLDQVDTSDPRKFEMRGGAWRSMALTSLSWLLPVELSPDGLEVQAVHYDRAIIPQASWQCYGVEDPRISRVDDGWLMTVCCVSPQHHGTALYASANGLDWQLLDLVLDHQNKDMVIFEGRIAARYWALTRPIGEHYFAWPPGAPWRSGPSINMATSPDTLHWKPVAGAGIRPRADRLDTVRVGGGTPPIRMDKGWLALWHGVEPKEIVGIYRTYWSILDADDPARILYTSDQPILEPHAELTRPLEDLMYVHDVVFTTGLADGDPVAAPGHYILASGEADLACRITHVPKSLFGTAD